LFLGVVALLGVRDDLVEFGGCLKLKSFEELALVDKGYG